MTTRAERIRFADSTPVQSGAGTTHVRSGAAATPAIGRRDLVTQRHLPRNVFVALSLAALALGWWLAMREEFTPKDGAGYWIGIAGASTLLFQLVYPLRKRARFMRRMGSAPSWFRLHMMLGVVGPILILYHSNFSLGATNSNVALFAMLAVAGSGIIGRYIFGRVHRDLSGAKSEVSDLLADATALLRDIESDVGGTSGVIAGRLTAAAAGIMLPNATLARSAAHALALAFTLPITRWRLLAAADAAITANSERNGWTSADRRAHRRAARTHLDAYLGGVVRASQLSLFERLFGLWHLFHLPLFCLLIVTAIVHIVAVHLY